MIKLVASDLDGTLLQNGSNKVPEEFIKTIQEMRKNGILFAAASGRQYHSLRRIFQGVEDEIAYICENGALTIYKGEILNRVEIPAKLAREMIQTIQSEPGTEALVSGTYTSFIHPKEEGFEEYIRQMGNQYKVVPDLMNIGEPYIKIALYEAAGTENRERHIYWQNKFPAPVKVVTSGALWLDMLFPNVHKGVGIEALSTSLGIKKEELVSFGDNYNDVEMFEASGISVAVENAKPGIKKICDYITPSVNEFCKNHLPSAILSR